MALSINRQKVAELLQIGIGVNDREYERYIREAMEFDLKELMTDEFYYNLTTSTEEKYTKLLTSKDYEFEDKKYTHFGLEKVLAYFSYARFVMYHNMVSTSHGIVVKKTPQSEPLAIEERKNFYYSHKAHAKKVFEGVKKYIERNISDYPEWNKKSIRKSFNTHVIQ